MSLNTTNTTLSSTFLNKTYADKTLLANARTQFVHAKFGQKRSVPKNQGKYVEFRRWELFDPADAVDGLTEGVTPSGQDLSQTRVEVNVKQYGAYVEVSDLLDATAIDSVIDDSAELLGEQLGTVLEWVTRDAMCAGNNVQYANEKTARNTLTASDVLSVEEIRKAVRTLKKNKARMFSGLEDGDETGKKGKHFICICSTDATFDLQNDPLWQDVSKYSASEQIYSGEIGRMFGVVFVESTEAKVFEEAGAESTDVHATLVFGKDAYGVIDIGSKGGVQTIVKNFGSAGALDPLDQRGSVGAKVMAYASKILNDNWIVRIEHGVSE